MAPTREVFEISGSRPVSFTKRNKKLTAALFASLLLLVAAVVVITARVTADNRNSSRSTSHSHSIIKSSCSSTLYPELCFSAITNANVADHNDVILASLNATVAAAKRNSKLINSVLKERSSYLTPRQKNALHDCLELIDDTLDELHTATECLTSKPSPRSQEDLETLLSSAITNQDTCLDGFSHSKPDKMTREEYLLEPEIRLEKMCSNVLAMIKKSARNTATGSDGRRLREEGHDEGGWPKWLSAEDRRLLLSGTVVPDVVVAADGSGNFTTVSEAVEAAPKSKVRYVIKIKAGVYEENVDVPSSKKNIMFLGEGRNRTIITGDRSVEGPNNSTTFHSATVAANGDMFLAKGVTFVNTAGPEGHQAVAFRSSSDFSAFYKCTFIAFQDTLYVHRSRQFYTNCTIVGTVDFIFGNAAAVLQHCDIHARRPGPSQKNMITAQGRTDSNQNTGIVIQKCRIDATPDLKPVMDRFPTFLGRPWKNHSRTVFMQSNLSDVVDPKGWYPWDENSPTDPLVYREYKNCGPGANTSMRVHWKGYKVITNATEAEQYTAGEFISGDSWLESTGFPYTLGL